MNFEYFVSDMAIESALDASFEGLTSEKRFSCGIVQRVLNVKNNDLAKRINRERGVYITYDCEKESLKNAYVRRAMSRRIAESLSSVMGRLKKSSPVLVIGLGNGEIIADALGERTLDGVQVTSSLADGTRQSVCAFSTGVLGTTGVQSALLAQAVAEKIKPSYVILVDSLATSSVQRVGASFQISTAGIAPGSGVGQDKEKINASVLGFNTLAIGVPLMLSMRTALYGLIKEYASSVGESIDEYTLRNLMSEKNVSNLVVSPKDIQFMVNYSAEIISNAINLALN